MDPQKQSNNSAPSNSSAISSSTANLSDHNRTPKWFGKPGHEARTEKWISQTLFVAQFPDHNPDLTKDWLVFWTLASDFESDTENTHTSSISWKPEGVLPDQWDGEGIPPTTLAAYAKDAPPWFGMEGFEQQTREYIEDKKIEEEIYDNYLEAGEGERNPFVPTETIVSEEAESKASKI